MRGAAVFTDIFDILQDVAVCGEYCRVVPGYTERAVFVVIAQMVMVEWGRRSAGVVSTACNKAQRVG